MATETLSEREALVDADASLARLQRMMEEAAATGALREEGLDRFRRTAGNALGQTTRSHRRRSRHAGRLGERSRSWRARPRLSCWEIQRTNAIF